MLRIIGISNNFFFFVKKQNRLPIVLLMSIFFLLLCLANQGAVQSLSTNALFLCYTQLHTFTVGGFPMQLQFDLMAS